MLRSRSRSICIGVRYNVMQYAVAAYRIRRHFWISHEVHETNARRYRWKVFLPTRRNRDIWRKHRNISLKYFTWFICLRKIWLLLYFFILHFLILLTVEIIIKRETILCVAQAFCAMCTNVCFIILKLSTWYISEI